VVKKSNEGFNLLDLIDVEEDKELATTGECLHRIEERGIREWPGFPGDPRMVWICKACGRLRGRVGYN